jgi:hypothetical protein
MVEVQQEPFRLAALLSGQLPNSEMISFYGKATLWWTNTLGIKPLVISLFLIASAL